MKIRVGLTSKQQITIVLEPGVMPVIAPNHTGIVVLATDWEIAELKKIEPHPLRIRPGFLTTDGYRRMDEKQKAALWREVLHITYDPTINKIFLRGEVVDIETALIYYNACVPEEALMS
jgi:hypothetical protein